jgi:hypothetical protein
MVGASPQALGGEAGPIGGILGKNTKKGKVTWP